MELWIQAWSVTWWTFTLTGMTLWTFATERMELVSYNAAQAEGHCLEEHSAACMELVNKAVEAESKHRQVKLQFVTWWTTHTCCREAWLGGHSHCQMRFGGLSH